MADLTAPMPRDNTITPARGSRPAWCCPRMTLWLLLLVLTCFLTHCTDDGERAFENTPSRSTATITFPGSTALLTYTPVLVRGTAQSPQAITRVTVNGTPATSTDGFTTWAATIDLSPGSNTIMVSVEDSGGHQEPLAAMGTLSLVAPLFAPRGIATDATGHLVVVDTQLMAVLQVDPLTGARRVLSGPGDRGPALLGPQGVAVEATGHLVLADAKLRALVRIEPTTGDRALVSGDTRGSGPPFQAPHGVAVEATGHLVVADFGPGPGEGTGAILRVEPTTGDRVTLSDQNVGGGEPISTPRGIVVEANGQLVVTANGRMLRVHPTTGRRTLLVSAPQQPDQLIFPDSLALAADGQLFVVNTPSVSPFLSFDGSALEENIRIARVDPVTGAFTIIANERIGRGPRLRYVRGIAVTAAGQVVITADGGLLQVDPQTGDRVPVAEERLGSGPALRNPGSIAHTPDGQIVVMTDDGVIAVAPRTGARASTSVIDGPALRRPRGVAVEASGTLVLTDAGLRAVLREDSAAGTRQIVSDSIVGSGPLFSSPQSIAVAADGSLFVADRTVSRLDVESMRILRVHPLTGDRTLVTASSCSGAFLLWTSLAVEPTGQFVVVQPEYQEVWRIDPGTGVCTVVSRGQGPLFGGGVGAGPAFGAPKGIAVEANGALVVVDPQRGVGRGVLLPGEMPLPAVLRVDPLTGDRTVLSDATTGRGPVWTAFGPIVRLPLAIIRPVAVLLNDGITVEASGSLLVTDPLLNAVFRVDRDTGDRVIISK